MFLLCLWCVPARVPTRRADRHAAAVRRMRDARSRRRGARRRERLTEAQLAADAVVLRPPPSLIAVHPPVRLRVVARADGSTVFVLSPTSSSSSAPAPAGKGDERDDRLGSTDAAARRDDDEAGEDGFDPTARPGYRRNA